jgi:hypothetical protein
MSDCWWFNKKKKKISTVWTVQATSTVWTGQATQTVWAGHAISTVWTVQATPTVCLDWTGKPNASTEQAKLSV